VPAGVTQDPGPSESIELRNKKFGNEALPFYAIVRPQGDDVATVRIYDRGLIKSVPEFAGFLQGALDDYKAARAVAQAR
jgi:hypothetical protein